MKILSISTYRQPTKGNGGNGLGRHVYDFLKLLKLNGDQVDVFCHPNSEIDIGGVGIYDYTHPANDLQKIYDIIQKEKYDLILDNCHHKLLSAQAAIKNQNLPIVNFVHDTECTHQPKNILLGNNHQKLQHPSGIVVPTGVLFDDYKAEMEKQDYYCFVGKIELRKGVDLAVQVQTETNKRIVFVGPKADYQPKTAELLKDQEWLGEITDNNKLKNIVAKSKGLLYLSRLDAGGLAIWEAAALGTPTFVIEGTGTSCNVVDKTTGFICKDYKEVCDLINKNAVDNLDPIKIREKSEKRWDLKNNFNKHIYPLFVEVAKGKRW